MRDYVRNSKPHIRWLNVLIFALLSIGAIMSSHYLLSSRSDTDLVADIDQQDY